MLRVSRRAAAPGALAEGLAHEATAPIALAKLLEVLTMNVAPWTQENQIQVTASGWTQRPSPELASVLPVLGRGDGGGSTRGILLPTAALGFTA